MNDNVYDGGPVPRAAYGATEHGGTDDVAWKALAREWYNLEPVRGDAWSAWATCAHRLSGARACDGVCEVVQPFQQQTPGHLWDHARAWRTTLGELVYTLEPWGNPFHHHDAFTKLRTALDTLGIAVGFEGRSMYGASYTLFLANVEDIAGISRVYRYGQRGSSVSSHPAHSTARAHAQHEETSEGRPPNNTRRNS